MEMIQCKIASVKTQLSALGYESFPIYVEIVPLTKGCAGIAYPLTSRISISSDYYNSEHKSEVISRTVPHEIVHLYVSKYFPMYKQAHGKEFRQLMKAIGCDISTHHSMQLPSMQKRKNKVLRYVYNTVCGQESLLTRAQHANANANNYTYSLHGKPLVYSGIEKRI